MTTVSAAHDQARDLRLRAGRAVDRGLGQAAVDDHAARAGRRPCSPRRGRAARGWRRSRSASCAAYVFAAPRPSANPTSMTPTAGPTRSPRSPVETSGSPNAGRPLLMFPTISTPWSSRANSVDRERCRARPRRASRARPARRVAGRARARATGAPTASVAPFVSPRLVRRSQSLLEEVAAALRDPEQLRGAGPMMIVSASPTMKPLSTGSEMKFARKPRRQETGDERHDPDDERQRGGHRGERAAARGHELARRSRPTARRSPTSARRRGGASCRRRRRARAPRARRRARRPERRPRSSRRRAPRARARPTR